MQEYQHLSGFFLARETTTTTTTTVRRFKKERSKKLATSLSTTPEAETETKKKKAGGWEKNKERTINEAQNIMCQQKKELATVGSGGQEDMSRQG